MKEPCVYLLCNRSHGAFYVGVTSDLVKRMHQYRTEAADGHTRRYGIKRLVWFERHDTMETAIVREKRIKRWSRDWKYDLVNEDNPTWRDLAEDLGFASLAEDRQTPDQVRGDG